MAYNKKTWKARQGLGLNKFSIDGATPVPIVNQPDSVTQQGDALSAGNLNDLEQRIADAFDDVEESKADKSTTDALQSQIDQHESRLENLEQKAGDYTTVQYRGTNAVPTGKAKYGLVKSFVGKSRAWNQLVENGNFVDTSGWSGVQGTLSANNNIGTLTISGSPINRNTRIQRSLSVPSGHALLVGAYVKSSRATQCVFSTDAGTSTAVTVSANVKTLVVGLIPAQSSATTVLYLFCNDTATLQQNDTVEFSEVFARDLTLIFGAGNEPSTVAEALAQLPALGEYNAYDAGSLVSTEVSGAEATGVNLWNEKWEMGEYDPTTGQKKASSTTIRSVGAIEVDPTKTYYWLASSIGVMFFYDENGNYLPDISYVDWKSNEHVHTLDSRVRYIRFRMSSAYGTVYKNDIQLCYDSLPTAVKEVHHDYIHGVLMLSSSVTLRSAGSVADTDELNVEVNGEAKRRQTQRISASYDLSTLEWSPSVAVPNAYYATFNVGYKFITNVPVLCDKYQYIGTSAGTSVLTDRDKVCALYYTPNSSIREIYVKDTSISSASQISGHVQFELETYVETISDPITDNTIYTEGGGTINTIQEQTPVIDNCLDVGYLTV